jgi:plasmid replication initiation protein
MREFMLQVRGNFTKTFEKYILPMNSMYAKRIYEMLIQNIDYGYRKFNLEEFVPLIYQQKIGHFLIS